MPVWGPTQPHPVCLLPAASSFVVLATLCFSGACSCLAKREWPALRFVFRHVLLQLVLLHVALKVPVWSPTQPHCEPASCCLLLLRSAGDPLLFRACSCSAKREWPALRLVLGHVLLQLLLLHVALQVPVWPPTQPHCEPASCCLLLLRSADLLPPMSSRRSLNHYTKIALYPCLLRPYKKTNLLRGQAPYKNL